MAALCLGGVAAAAVISCSDMITDASATGVCSAEHEGECADGVSRRSYHVPVHKITIVPWIDTIAPGEKLQLTAVPKDHQGYPLEGRDVVWSAGRHGAASVDSDGLVTGLKEGVETITAASEGKEGYAAIHVLGSTSSGVARVSIDPASAAVQVGNSTQLTATAFDAAGKAMSGQDFTWTSSSAAVAQVTGSGLVTGNGAGTATITASTGGVSSTANVTVTAPAPTVARVIVTPATASVEAGSTVQFTATARDAGGNTIAGQTFTWSSSNTSAATVTSSGVVSGIAAGTATITARTSGVAGSASVTVTTPTAAVASVTMTPTSGNVEVGGTIQFVATARDADGNAIPGRTFAWSSSSSTIASVSASGLVTGRSGGTATIRANTSGISATASVTVRAASPVVTQVTISPASANIQLGGSTQLVATARDANGNPVPGQTFAWSSSNTGVATVSSSGGVLGTGEGSATITALASGVSGTAAVTVTTPPSTVENRVIFFSDWRTARGWSEQAYTDGGKWDFVSDDRGVPNKEIVAGAPLDFPTENVFRVHCTAQAECWSMLRKTGLSIPAVGESRFYRWYFRSTQPDGLDDSQTHPIQDGFAASNSNWMFININGGRGNVPGGQWQPQFWAYVAPYPNQRWYGPNLNKNQTYRFEVQIHRVTSNQFRMHVRVYNSAGAQIASDADFRNYDEGVTLATNPIFPFSNVANMDGMNAGNNGIGGSPPFPFTYAYEGAFAICADSWCGAYNGAY